MATVPFRQVRVRNIGFLFRPSNVLQARLYHRAWSAEMFNSGVCCFRPSRPADRLLGRTGGGDGRAARVWMGRFIGIQLKKHELVDNDQPTHT